MKIKKDDKVKVISGKDRGKTGKVIAVIKSQDRIVIKGVNIVKKHQKATTDDKPKGIIEFEAPIHVSNVMVLDPKDNKPTRVGYKIEKDKKVRITKRSKTILD